MPDCDCIVDFDGATTSRVVQQRGGRARAKNATYLHLVRSDDTAVRQHYVYMRQWNEIAMEVLADGGERERPPTFQSAAEAREKAHPDCVITLDATGRTCALLPRERCTEFLHRVYKADMVVRPGDASFELDLTSDGSHFTAKGGHSNFKYDIATCAVGQQKGLFSCTLTLPGVNACSKDFTSKGQLPKVLACDGLWGKKEEAKSHAALWGVRYLYDIGVLDEHLSVVGRGAILREIREAAGRGRRRSSTRSNKYALHTKEPVVRALPALLREPPSRDAVGALHVWCHPMEVDGVSADMALLLRGPCPAAVRELMVGSDTGRRRRYVLKAGYPLTLSEEQARRLGRMLVGWHDLLQAGNSGEPLHPSLQAPRQLLRFEQRSGTFIAEEIAADAGESGGLPLHLNLPDKQGTANGIRSEASSWRQEQPPGERYEQAVGRLSRHIENVVERLQHAMRRATEAAEAAEASPAAEGAGGVEGAEGAEVAADAIQRPAVVVTLDLDHTLWPGECREWPVGSFQRFQPAQPGDWSAPRKVVDQSTSGDFLELHKDVPLIFDALGRAGVPIAIASASPAADSARALLRAFGLADQGGHAMPRMEMGEDEEAREGHKVVQIQRLSEHFQLPYDAFVLFDDGPRNVETVREVLCCSALLVDPSVGLTAEALLRGLEHRVSEVNMRTKLRLAEARELNPENRRKLGQSYADRIAQGQAEVDQGRVDSQLAKMEVKPAWWLVAPLEPRRDDQSGDPAIDWRLADRALELLGTAKWPSLNQSHHPLVAPSFSAKDDELMPGRLKLCALATYAAGRHHDFLCDAKVEEDGTVTGHVASRTVHANAAAARRRMGADAKWTNTEQRPGYKPADVWLLPLRSSQHPALVSLRRLLWRLEHLLRLCEPDVADLIQMPLLSPPMSPPLDGAPPEPPAVPIDLLSAALTHKGANAEAIHPGEAVSAGCDLFRQDQRGCCHWDSLEWFGDAVLLFFGVVHVLVESPPDQRFSRVNDAKEAIVANLPLYRQGQKHRIDPHAGPCDFRHFAAGCCSPV